MKNNTAFYQPLFALALMLLGFNAMAQEPKEETEEERPQPIAIAKDLLVTPITDDSWMWTAYKNPEGKPPALNGLLYITDTMVICVNVPWFEKHVDQLANFCLDKLQRRLGKLILTGFQPQRAPALKAFKKHGLVFHGTLANRTLANARSLPGPDQVFTKRQTLEIDGRIIQLYNPGPVMARDHVIVFLPDDSVMFMGPLIRSPRAKVKGLSPAKLQAWEKALQDSQRRFPGAKHLIPERGPMAGLRAIASNYILIRQASKQ